MRAKSVTIMVALVAASILAPRRARADAGLLVLGGNATERERTAIGGAVEGAIRAAGWTVSLKALSKKDSDGLLKCPDSKSPWTCIPSALSNKGISAAFVISIDMIQNDSGAPVVAISGKMITTNPPAFAVRERYCERCADDKLVEAGQDVIQQLTHDLAKRSGRTVVAIKSIPSSGTLIFDGEQLGGTDATFATFPGMHTAMVQKPGYVSEIRQFTVDEGKTAEITLTLQPSATGENKRDPPPDRSRQTPLIIVGAGSALTVFGVVSLIEGQRDMTKFDYTRASAVGIATSAVGLGAVGVGLYLLWRKPDAGGPSASVSSNAVAFGWSGRF
jgi:hypothetical protein